MWFSIIASSAAIFLISVIISLLLGHLFITRVGHAVRALSRELTPETHRLKNNTPTMGGFFVIATIVISSLFFLYKSYSWWNVFCINLLGFGAIGFCDDMYKIICKKGISARVKFIAQFILATIVALLFVLYLGISTELVLPFTSYKLEMGYYFIFWVIFVLLASCNAVNLTDGLDGLAISIVIINFIVFYGVHSVAGNHDIAFMIIITVGASLGFFWYNAYPAQVIMGDVGSLALGATLAFFALSSKYELLLPFSGIIFVAETISVVVQVIGYRLFKRRIFKMAPLHHHFELMGWAEQKIVTRFMLITVCASFFVLFFVIDLSSK